MGEVIRILWQLNRAWVEQPGASISVVSATGGIDCLTVIGRLHKAGIIRYDPVRQEVRPTEAFGRVNLYDILRLSDEEVADPLTARVLKGIPLTGIYEAMDDFHQAIQSPTNTPENRRGLDELWRRIRERERERKTKLQAV